MFDKKIFGNRVLELRTSKNISQQALADSAHVGKSTISMIENGQRAASVEVLVMFSKLFDVSVDYLLGLTDNPKVNH